MLARLSTISEAGTSSFDPQTSHGSSESRPPAGFQEGELSDEALKDRSLFDLYRQQFIRAEGDDFHLMRLYLMAERDYLIRRYRIAPDGSPFARKGVPTLSELRSSALTVHSGAAAENTAIERVIKQYEGVPAVEVAIYEGTTERWVVKARKLHNRQPHDGTPRPQFLDWDDERRHREVAKLAAQGMGAPTIAHRLRVSEKTVRRYYSAA